MEEIFDKLVKVGLTPNAFYILYCSKHKRIPNSFVSHGLESRKLQVEKWLNHDLELTEKSINFIPFFRNFWNYKIGGIFNFFI